MTREQQLEAALREIQGMAESVRHGQQGGQQVGPSAWNMTVGTKRRILLIAAAALSTPPPADPECESCGEHHSAQSMCPPHEVRRGTGPWNRQPQKPVTGDTIVALQRENAVILARLERVEGALRDVAIRRGCSEWDEPFQKCGLCNAVNDGDSPLNHRHDCQLADRDALCADEMIAALSTPPPADPETCRRAGHGRVVCTRCGADYVPVETARTEGR